METSTEITDRFINDASVMEAKSIMISVEENLDRTRCEEHVRTLQDLVSASDEKKKETMDVMKTVGVLLESARSSNKSEYSVKIGKFMQKVQR